MYVVSVAVGAVFKQSLSLLVHARAVQEALQLISTSADRQWHTHALRAAQSETYTRLFRGVPGPPSSAVGTNCSPGRTHSMGPSSLWLRDVRLSEEREPQGRVLERKGLCSRRSAGRESITGWQPRSWGGTHPAGLAGNRLTPLPPAPPETPAAEGLLGRCPGSS